MFKARGWCGVLGEQLQCHSSGAGGVWEQLTPQQCTPRVARLWDTPIPGEGCGGLRVTHTSHFAAHVGDLLRGLKVRPLKAPVLPPHATTGKEQRLLPFALPSSLLSSRKRSNTQARNGAQSIPKVPQAPVHEQEPCALQSATCSCPWISPCMGDPPAPVQSPRGGHRANTHPTNLTCRSATAGKCIWQTLLFTNSSNLEDKVPSLSPAPGRGVTTRGETSSRCPHLMAKV